MLVTALSASLLVLLPLPFVRVFFDSCAIRSIAHSSGLSSHWSEYGARHRTCFTRCGLWWSWKVFAPLGQSVPSLIGLFGFPSMSMTSPALV